MITSPKSRLAFAAAFAIAVSSLIAVDAFAGTTRNDNGRQAATAFAATPTTGGGVVRRDPESCHNAASCNIMIAYCIGTGGTFDESPGGHNGSGQPTDGTCTWPN